MGNCLCLGSSQDEEKAYYKNKNIELLMQVAQLKQQIRRQQKLNQKRGKQMLSDQIRNNAPPANIQLQHQPQQRQQQVNNLQIHMPVNKAKDTQLDELKRVNDELKENIRNLQSKFQQLKMKMSEKPRAAVDQNIDAFCQGEILDDDEDYKIYLRQALQRKIKKKIRKTKHLCSEHRLNKYNLHEFVDGIDNILIILQIQETGYKIAAWTEKAFKYPRIEQGDGLIFSLTKRIQFGRQPGKRAINYDETFLIFGNADLRFNNDTKSLYCNFGNSTSYYESKGCRVDTLMGKLQRELKLKSYEIYQLQCY